MSLTDGVGNGDARRLLASFGSPAANFAQAPTALTNVVTPKQAQALFQEPHEVTLQCVRTQQWLAHAAPGVGHAVWTLGVKGAAHRGALRGARTARSAP